MRRSQTLKVNSEIIRNQLQKKGLTLTDVSKKMGFASTYLSHKLCKNPGVIGVSDSYILDSMFGLSREQYEYKEPVKQEKEEPVEVEEEKKDSCLARIYITEDDWQKLYSVINKAVYEGVKRAWENG